jgi:endonuclease YncB( thermonuclease family)
MAKSSRSHPRRRAGKRSRSGAVFIAQAFMLMLAAAGWFGYDTYIKPESAPATEAGSTEAEAKPTPASKTETASYGKGSEISGVASVVDADTLDVHGERIRLVGVDAPESKQQCRDAGGQFYRCGQVSALALDAWLNSNPVTCKVEDRDRYSRFLAQCSVRGTSVQEWLVTNGYAVAYRSYSKEYIPAEEKAHAAKAGIWAAQFVNPWEWRKGVRLEGEKPAGAKLASN